MKLITKYYNALVNIKESDDPNYYRHMDYDIGYRGGYLKVTDKMAVEITGIPEKYEDNLPQHVGAGCNYLGGGLRGGVFTTGDAQTFIEHGIPKTYAKRLEALCQALKTFYIELEGALNNEVYEDGDTNWDAIGTNTIRANKEVQNA